MSMALSDVHVDFPICEGTLLASCYEVQAFLGEGSFGKVAKCADTVSNTIVAIKIIKDKPFFAEQALQEIKILKELQTVDSDNCHLVRWNGSFFHQRFICLQFELLDLSLREYMLQRQFQPLSMDEISPVLHQLTTALLHLEGLDIMHADLKPENIMIVNHRQKPLQVKIIDFGLARHVSDAVPGTCVQSLWYRAPEVMLGLVYTESIDMWSLGLIAAELALGFPVFPGSHEYDMMKFIVDTLGQPPDYLLNCALKSTQFFNMQDGCHKQTWTLKTPEEFSMCAGHHFTDSRCFDFQEAWENIMNISNKAERNKLQHFVDLLKKMLLVDKNGRIIPIKVLEHSFFSVDQHTDMDMNINHLVVNTEEAKITQQISSQKHNQTFEIVCFHGESTIAGPENVSVKQEGDTVVVDTSKKRTGRLKKFFKRIRKAFSFLAVKCHE